ncbi:MAG: mechanosensitive ion channel [Phycisphaerales bacterium]|nr:mechanosensitive ion channel [Phycisphaerales bacterium]
MSELQIGRHVVSMLCAQAGGAPTDAQARPAGPTGPSAMEQLVLDPTAAVSTWTKRAWELLESYGPRVLGAIILLVAAFMVAGWAKRVVLGVMDRAKIDLTLAKFLSNVVRWTIVIFALITSAGTLGADTTGFAAAIAAAGLAVGLALQGNLGNLASGVLIMIFRPFKIGDAVIVAGQMGIVDGIDLFTTNLDTADNRRIIVPNGQIFGGVIENQTRHPSRSVAVSVQVSPAADVERTRGLLEAAARRAAAQAPGALAQPAPAVALGEISPVTWTVSVWAQTASFGAVRQALLRELKVTIDREGLAPPAPTTQVHIRSMPGPA